jgi:hypothetical protein
MSREDEERSGAGHCDYRKLRQCTETLTRSLVGAFADSVRDMAVRALTTQIASSSSHSVAAYGRSSASGTCADASLTKQPLLSRALPSPVSLLSQSISGAKEFNSSKSDMVEMEHPQFLGGVDTDRVLSDSSGFAQAEQKIMLPSVVGMQVAALSPTQDGVPSVLSAMDSTSSYLSRSYALTPTSSSTIPLTQTQESRADQGDQFVYSFFRSSGPNSQTVAEFVVSSVDDLSSTAIRQSSTPAE